jgi:hypothetical protein
MSQKSQFSIKKVIKVYRMLDNELQPERYEVWKLSGPRGFVKHFVTKKDAQAFLKNYTSNKIVK